MKRPKRETTARKERSGAVDTAGTGYAELLQGSQEPTKGGARAVVA
jgi:hypothetical protein